MEATARPRQPIQKLELIIERVVRETPDTVTIHFEKTAEAVSFKAGQFLNIDVHQFPALRHLVAYLHKHKNRKEPARAYSLTSAPHEPQLAITIKEEPVEPEKQKFPAVLSPFLVHCTRAGDRMTVTGFQGPYVIPDDIDEKTDHVVHLVAGSGAVPNFSMVKDALHRGLRIRHTFINSNKTWKDVIFREELDALAEKHPDKLRLVHTLTRESDESSFDRTVRRGRVSLELLKEFIPDAGTAYAYVCGPAISSWERRTALEGGAKTEPKFLETVIGLLHELDIPDKRIKREAYG